MRQAKIFLGKIRAGTLIEQEKNRKYRFEYMPDYAGPPISLTLPTQNNGFDFERFPPYFEGLLPEGAQLESLLRIAKLDRDDFFGQLLTVGGDLIGAVTVEPVDE